MSKFGSLIWGLEETIKNRMRSAPEMVVSDPNVIQRAIDEIRRLRGEIQRLRGIIRSCHHGTEITDLGDGELIGLSRPNKEK